MSKAAWLQHASSFILGIFFINVGIGHFLDPEWFEPIVPTILGDATFLGISYRSNGSRTRVWTNYSSNS